MSGENLRFHLPKWPFIVADCVLLGVAAWIGISMEGSDGWKGFWLFLLVGLAFIALVFPFAVEFATNARLAQFESERERKRSLRRLDALEADLARASQVIGTFTQDSGEASELAQDQREALSALESRLDGLEKANKSLAKEIAFLRESMPPNPSTQLKALDARIDGLEAAHTEVTAQLRADLGALRQTLEEQPRPVPDTAAGNVPPADAPESDRAEEGPRAALPLGEDVPAETVADAEPDTLQEEPLPEGEEEPEAEAESKPAFSDPEAEAEPDPELTEAYEEEEEEGEDFPEDEETGDEEDAWNAFAAAPVDDDEGAILPEDDSAEDELEIGGETGGPEQADLISGLPDTRKRARRARKNSTALVANMLIGIGNTPYVRGEGGGLSWDEGQPMEFLEIGRWQWVPKKADEPIRLRVYKNDEIPSVEDEIVIEPGQRREASIHFPSPHQ